MTEMLRIKDVTKATGLPRGTVYHRISKGMFPKSVKLGLRTAAWQRHEIDEYNNAYVKGFTPEQIKALVRRIESERGK
jgi:prophage regulatory protein